MKIDLVLAVIGGACYGHLLARLVLEKKAVSVVIGIIGFVSIAIFIARHE